MQHSSSWDRSWPGPLSKSIMICFLKESSKGKLYPRQNFRALHLSLVIIRREFTGGARKDVTPFPALALSNAVHNLYFLRVDAIPF